MRHGAIVQRHRLVHHHRTGTTVDDHLGRHLHRHQFEVLDETDKSHTLVRIERRLDAHLPTIRSRGCTRRGAVDDLDQLLHGAEIGGIKIKIYVFPLSQRRRHFTLDGGAAGDASDREMIDGGSGAARRGTGAADHDIALGEGENIAIGPLQRR